MLPDEQNNQKYPHPDDDSHDHEKHGFSLLGELISSMFNGLFNSVKKVITFLITTLFCLMSVLDLSRELLLSVYYYFCLSRKSRELLHIVLMTKNFYLVKNDQILILNQSLNIKIQPKDAHSHFANLEHDSSFITNSLNKALSSVPYQYFMHYHVDHILMSLLKLKNCHIFSYRYEIKLTTKTPYKSFKNDVLKTKHLLKNL